jgi:GT2 family glycosyltransferase
MTTLSIVIVNHNVRELLRECLTSLQESLNTGSQYIDCETIVVDSGSNDGSQAMIRKNFPYIQLLDPGANIGFSKGNNLGIAASTSEYVLLLNPDTKIMGNALHMLLAHLAKFPEVGAVGPQLLNADGSVQSSRRRFPTIFTALFESTWLQPLAPRWVTNHYYVLDRSDSQIQSVDWVTGAALMIRRAVIDQIGGMDEGFFMYSEELDWQKRIRLSGWKIQYVPEARLVHYGGKSSEQVPAQTHIAFQTSKIRYFRKYHGNMIARFMRMYLLTTYMAQVAIEYAKLLLRHRIDLRRARIATYRQVLQSGLREIAE